MRADPARRRAIRAARRPALGFQITFALIFIVVALLFLAAAVLDRDQFRDPAGAARSAALVAAAERVRGGDLAARVPEGDERRRVRLAEPRLQPHDQPARRASSSELIEANRQLDERRRFTETVLTGVSAGVIGLDRDGRINLPNRSASAAARRRSRPVDRRGPRRGRARDGRAARRGASAGPTGWRRRRSRSPARQQHPHAAGAHRRRARRRARSAAMSSPSTTSPSCCRRSARRPGPTSPAASPTRSRTR